jgi:hypothetical protein
VIVETSSGVVNDAPGGSGGCGHLLVTLTLLKFLNIRIFQYSEGVSAAMLCTTYSNCSPK